MLGGRGDPLLAAHDVGDTHLEVVDDHGEVVGGEPVGLEDDLVVGPGRGHPSTDEVVELQGRVVRHEHPHDGRRGEARERPPLLLALAEAQPVVPGGALGSLLLLAHLGEALGGAPASVGVSVGQQSVHVGLVRVEPLALPVRRAGAADVRPLVPDQPEPAQGVEDLPLGVLTEAGLVGVLDPQHEAPTLLAHEREVEERHVRRSDVRVAGRRRRHPQPDGAGEPLPRGGGLVVPALWSVPARSAVSATSWALVLSEGSPAAPAYVESLMVGTA